MKYIPSTDSIAIIGTGFGSNETWEQFLEQVEAWQSFEFSIVDDPEFSGLQPNSAMTRLPSEYPHGVVFLADAQTFADAESPLMAIDVKAPGENIRITLEASEGLAANIDVANMEFEAWAQNVDEDGVFREFKESPNDRY